MCAESNQVPLCPEFVRECLGRAIDADASDVHLIVGYPPVLRVHGDLVELAEPVLAAESVNAMLTALCPADALERLRVQKNIDFSFHVEVGGALRRFRANVFYAGRNLGACLRVIPAGIPDFDWAG